MTASAARVCHPLKNLISWTASNWCTFSFPSPLRCTYHTIVVVQRAHGYAYPVLQRHEINITTQTYALKIEQIQSDRTVTPNSVLCSSDLRLVKVFSVIYLKFSASHRGAFEPKFSAWYRRDRRVKAMYSTTHVSWGAPMVYTSRFNADLSVLQFVLLLHRFVSYSSGMQNL